MKCLCGATKCNCVSYLSKAKSPATAEELMRSRYVAFATSDVQYLLNTSSNHLKQSLTIDDLRSSCEVCQFIELIVLDSGPDWVEFKAFYIVQGSLECIHEVSQFVKENNEWKYDCGELFDVPMVKLQRNQKCPCHSGKKFKQCHGK